MAAGKGVPANELREAALEYAHRGWQVFPIKPGEKFPPLLKEWQNKASSDSETIRRWWLDNPHANIGINCGASGLFVVDQDVKDGVDGIANWRALATTNGFSSDGTLTNITPSGGRHSIHQKPDGADLRNTQNKAGEWAGIDTRGNGGYIVAPPSVVGGKVYRFEDDSAPVLPLPAPAVALFTAPKKKSNAATHKPGTASAGGSLLEIVQADGHALERKGTLAEWCGRCPWCGGHDRFVVGWDGEGRDGGQRYYCRQCGRKGDAVSWLVDCKGLGVAEAKDARGVAVPAGLRRVPATFGTEPSVIGAEALAAVAGEPRRLTLITALGLLERKTPPREYLLNPWLRAKDTGMVYGWRGLGKTFFALGIAGAAASGGKFLKWQATKPRKVLYIDGELPEETLRERLATVAAACDFPDIFGENLSFLTPDLQDELGMPNLADPAGQALLLPYLVGVEFVVLDNLSTLCRGGAENDAETWQPVQDFILALRRRGIAVLMVHHAGKGGAQRGTSKREDVLDFSLNMKKPADYNPQDGARFEVHFEKARGAKGGVVEPFEVKLDDVGGPVWTMKDLVHARKDRVLAMTAEGLTGAEIAKELGCHKSTVSRILKGQGGGK